MVGSTHVHGRTCGTNAMTVKAFIGLLLLIPILMVAANDQLLAQMEGPLVKPLGKPKVEKAEDWRKEEAKSLKADDWRKVNGKVDPSSYSVKNAAVTTGAAPGTVEGEMVLKGTDQVLDNATIEGATPIPPQAPETAATSAATRRTEQGGTRLLTERSTPGAVGGLGNAADAAN